MPPPRSNTSTTCLACWVKPYAKAAASAQRESGEDVGVGGVVRRRKGGMYDAMQERAERQRSLQKAEF